MDTFLALFERGRTDAFAFADDGALIVVANTLSVATKLMQNALDKVCRWAKKNKLKFMIWWGLRTIV